ncbi:MAG: hypothetical protein GQ570_14060 [Helicobacteraceae bacterium]|nr:hypothetical protein [Helicobacteraceae bacterium]
MKKIITATLLTTTALLAADVGLNISKGGYSTSSAYPTAIVKPDTDVTGYELFYSNDCILIDRPSVKNYASITLNKTENTSEIAVVIGLVEEYKVSKATLAAGALVGYGQLSYDYNPLTTSLTDSRTTSSALYGFTATAKYPIVNNFFLNVNAKYLWSNYEVDLKDGANTGQIKHNNLYTLGLGVGYSF